MRFSVRLIGPPAHGHTWSCGWRFLRTLVVGLIAWLRFVTLESRLAS
jgi:hypothetical protein